MNIHPLEYIIAISEEKSLSRGPPTACWSPSRP